MRRLTPSKYGFVICVLMFLTLASVWARTADRIRLKAHETTKLHIGEIAVLQIPSERDYEREYYESADEQESVKLPILSKRRYEVELAGDALTAFDWSSCERSVRPDAFGDQHWSCKPSATIRYRARHADRAAFVLTPTDGNHGSRHCIDCTTWHYFVEVVP
jgi:hypothetical protein